MSYLSVSLEGKSVKLCSFLHASVVRDSSVAWAVIPFDYGIMGMVLSDLWIYFFYLPYLL